ncbi:MAG TPA: DUF4157 domain-containing protein [Pyrinomonadaceae bacterium]|nr:DUF4157 domain-containing protein [Pyrinomonadaceae bacterium]
MKARDGINEAQKEALGGTLSPASLLVQRKCACGGSAGLTGHCADCDKEQLVQRSATAQASTPAITNQLSEDLTNDVSGHDFSRISVNAKEAYGIQTKLAISQPGDRFEREADQVAEQVMRSGEEVHLPERPATRHLPTISRWINDSQIARQPAEEEEEQNSEQITVANVLSLKEAPGGAHSPSPQLSSQIHSMRGSGERLSSDLRDFFEPRFGHDFSKVRIHTDARAAATTRSLNARAYTLGSDIAFASSEYKPDTTAGRRLLAHELTHVVQQSDRVQTVMRACDCAKAGASKAASSVDSSLRSIFPQLKTGEYCVTAPATSKYNCFAWSVGDTSKWLDNEVDTVHGNNNGKLEYSDFDSMYAKRGLKPVIGSTPSDPQVALYGIGADPTHAARRRSDLGCGNFESKLGASVRITHYPQDLEGGTVYGNVNRYYVPDKKSP